MRPYLEVSRFLSRISRYFFFQAEDGIRDVERSRGLGDVYKRQVYILPNNLWCLIEFSGTVYDWSYNNEIRICKYPTLEFDPARI